MANDLDGMSKLAAMLSSGDNPMALVAALSSQLQRPDDVGFRQFNSGIGNAMAPPAVMSQGNTTFGGMPYAPNPLAANIAGVGAVVSNTMEALRVARERKRAEERQRKLEELLDLAIADMQKQMAQRQSAAAGPTQPGPIASAYGAVAPEAEEPLDYGDPGPYAGSGDSAAPPAGVLPKDLPPGRYDADGNPLPFDYNNW